MVSEQRWDELKSLGIVVLIIIPLLVLAFESGRGLDPNYVELFTRILVIDLIVTIVMIIMNLLIRFSDNEFTITPYSTSPARGFAHTTWAKPAGMIILFVLFIGGSVLSEHSIIPIINPYDSGHLLTSSTINTIPSTLITGLRSGAYAGIGEDMLGWLFVNTITLILLVLARVFTKMEDVWSLTPLVIICGIISCAVWAVVFATGHLLAYGVNIDAYAGAAFYGFISQLVNFLVGAPVSIITHFANNFAFIVGIGIAWSIGGVIATNTTKNGTITGALLMTKIKNWKLPSPAPKAKRGQSNGIAFILFFLCAVIGILILLAITGVIKPGGLYDVSGGSSTTCGTYTTIPNIPACATDAECVQAVTGGQSLASNLQIACNAGTCQAQLTKCGVVTQ